MAPGLSSLILLLLCSSFSMLAADHAACLPPLAPGLSYNFYMSTCPALQFIVRSQLANAFQSNPGLAAGLLRLHFHDCFVQGCDASVLLDGSASGPSEQQAPPNLSLQKAAFKAINDLRAAIDRVCGRVVSCADVVALAARDSVALSGGPDYLVPLGRRDGLTFATQAATLASLPPPTSNVSFLLTVLGRLGLDAADLVALSGGHTIGIAHCPSFTNRLYPTQDPTMDGSFAGGLKRTCPAPNTNNTTFNDIRTPNTFDNAYFVDLVNRQGLFTSDQGLFGDSRTSGFVSRFAADQMAFFFQFVNSMVKMGQLSVLTGNQGEIRANCSARNSGVGGDGDFLWPVGGGEEEGGSAAAY